VLGRGNNPSVYESAPESLFVGVKGVNISDAYKIEIVLKKKRCSFSRGCIS